MGITGIWQWLVVLLIVALLFGTKKLRNVGSDLGAAVKNFKKGMTDEDEAARLEKSENDSSTASAQQRDNAESSDR